MDEDIPDEQGLTNADKHPEAGRFTRLVLRLLVGAEAEQAYMDRVCGEEIHRTQKRGD